jgi:hypothetical protein
MKRTRVVAVMLIVTLCCPAIFYGAKDGGLEGPNPVLEDEMRSVPEGNPPCVPSGNTCAKSSDPEARCKPGMGCPKKPLEIIDGQGVIDYICLCQG